MKWGSRAGLIDRPFEVTRSNALCCAEVATAQPVAIITSTQGRREKAMKNPAIALAILAAMLNASAACADGASDDAAVRNRITCYPFGIDKIGRGDSEG
jgi:hypothetical protein